MAFHISVQNTGINMDISIKPTFYSFMMADTRKAHKVSLFG